MRYITKRLVQALLTVYISVTLTFVLIKQMPGGPMEYLRRQLVRGMGEANVDMALVEQYITVYTNLQPDAPLYVEYYNYMTSVMQGQLGISVWYNRPVTEILLPALPWTVLVMATSLLISFIIAIALGAMMAYYEASRFDLGMTSFGLLISSVPYYIFALILIAFLGFRWGLFPTGGRYAFEVDPGLTVDFVSSVIYHAALPVISMVVTGWGTHALSMRGNSIRVLGSDYLRVADLRGLSDKRIAFRYVARNAILPLYTGLMVAVGFMFGGSVILESIFEYPGIGYYLYVATLAHDYPLMMGGFLVITFSVILCLLVADLTYSFLDPRADTEEADKNTYGIDFSLRGIKTWVIKWAAVIRSRSDRSEDEHDWRPSDTAFGHDAKRSREGLSKREKYERILELRVIAPIKIIWNDWRSRAGILILAVFGLAGTVGVVLWPRPEPFQGDQLVQPFESWDYPLGTDSLGRDLFGLMIHSTPAMLEMVIVGAVVGTGIAVVLGTLSGYVGGNLDKVIMSAADAMMAIPGLPLLLVLVAIFQPERPWVVGVILAIDTWPGLTRALRSQVLTMRDEPYVESSRTLGFETGSILRFDIVPQLMPYISINFMQSARGIIFSSVGLYFLAVLPFSHLNWGVVLNFAYQGGALQTPGSLHWLLVPVFTIILFTFGIILLAQGMDRLFNPRVRARHVEMKESPGQDEGPTVTATPQGDD